MDFQFRAELVNFEVILRILWISRRSVRFERILLFSGKSLDFMMNWWIWVGIASLIVRHILDDVRCVLSILHHVCQSDGHYPI